MYTIYGKDNCVWCQRAAEFLLTNNMEFEMKYLEKDFSVEEFKTRFPGLTTVPQIVYKETNRHIGGYDQLVEFVKNGSV